MPRLYNLLLIAILCCASQANACICDTPPLEEITKKAPFIAHVKILYNEQGIGNSATRPIRIIELFKGDSVKKIREYDMNSSCEVGLQPGEEWILFAYYDSIKKIYSVGACTASRMLKNKDGERGSTWSWGQLDGTLKFLRNYFGHASPDPVYVSGKYKNYYPNGQLEWEASYQNGKLDGNRKIYYANGILWQNENYKQGKKDGVLQRFGRSGQLMDEMHYAIDKIRYSSYWYDTSYESRSMAIMFESRTFDRRINDSILQATPPVIQKSAEAVYDEYGNYHSKRYDRTGWLEAEMYAYDLSTNKVTCEYNKTGLLVFEEIVTKYNERIVDKKWNEKGELISHKEWEKGKYLGDKLAGKPKDSK